jgi:hypothetical protein
VTEDHTAPSEVTRVAQDLSTIVELAAHLDDQAEHLANDRDYLPGGMAMVALAPVANLEAWQYRVDTVMRAAYDAGTTPPEIDDTDEDYEPPLQTLLFWSEQWRVEHGREIDRRPTVASEAAFIRECLDWAWANEPQFADFAEDVSKARVRLENVLLAGKRSQHGVQCFDCQVDLVRDSRDPKAIHHCTGHDGVCTIPHRFCPHDRGGLSDEWRCPSCDRKYDVEAYRRAVGHAHFVHADFLPLVECAERTGARGGTIKVWANRGQVRRRKDQATGRVTYCVADIEARLPDEGVAS